MKFSLIMGTVGRTHELERFLGALDAQTYRDFELLVVDQNGDDRLTPILDRYSNHFTVLHLRSPRGLSKARNVGLGRISGDVVAFPDDDCWYPEELLRRIHYLLTENATWDGITCGLADEYGAPFPGKWDTYGGLLTPENVWRRGISWATFLRRRLVDSVGGFDETLGVGAGTPWGSGEETDYLLSAIEQGYQICYEPGMVVHHPTGTALYDAQTRNKTYRYSLGMGRVLKKHRYPAHHVFGHYILRPVGGALLAVVFGDVNRALHYVALARGRLRGYMMSVSSDKNVATA